MHRNEECPHTSLDRELKPMARIDGEKSQKPTLWVTFEVDVDVEVGQVSDWQW